MIYPDKFSDYTTALLVALEAKSNETGSHAKRVARIALNIGRELTLTQPRLAALKFGSLLHDVGKIRTPDAVLAKPGRLTDEEREIMRRHPGDGAALLIALGFPREISAIVLQHHETFDGSGYPRGLAGDRISIEARIFAVADTYDAITRDRCYRKGAHDSAARLEIQEWTGRQFDPRVVDAFLHITPERLQEQ